MERYIRNLIQKLYEIYNYNIIEFGHISGLCTSWGVAKKKENITDVIFFSNLNTSVKFNKEDFIDFLSINFNYDNIRLTEVLVDRELKFEINENGETYLSHRIYPQCELILINPVDNKIVQFNSVSEDKVNELANCMNYIRSTNKSSTVSKISVVTFILIATNVLAYILTAYLSGNIIDSNINVLIFLGAKVNSLISQGQYYRLATCMFLHGGIIHLALNMYALNALGPLVENIYGKVKYIIIYFLSGIVSSIFSYIFSNSVSIGASGAIFGLLGAALVFAVKMKNSIGKDFIRNILSVIVVNLIIGFSIANVDNFGHIGGLLGGIVTSLAFKGDGSQFFNKSR